MSSIHVNSSISIVGMRRLHVTNLPFKVNDENLKKLFSEHGVVAEAEIIYNERGSKGEW